MIHIKCIDKLLADSAIIQVQISVASRRNAYSDTSAAGSNPRETHMATVFIPTPLRRLTDGTAKVDIEATSVGEALQALEEAFPGVGEKILDQNGEVKRFINVFRNDDEIRALEGLATPVTESDRISIVPAMAGGCT